MDEEVKFFTEGLGMKVVRQREVNGARNVFVAYGEETLANKNGGGAFHSIIVWDCYMIRHGAPPVFELVLF